MQKSQILGVYRRGIHSARDIARCLGWKTRRRQLEVQAVLQHARLPMRRLWMKEEDEKLIRLYPKHSAARIARWLTRSVSSVHGRANKLGIHPLTIRGGFKKGRHYHRSTEFKKDQTPWNKGKHYQPGGRSKETRFKKGQSSRNELSDGVITIRTDHKDRHDRKYKWIRISKNRWRMLHVVVWENAHGPIPPGHIIVFANGDSMDCSLANLRCIDRIQHAANTRAKDGYIAKCLSHTKGSGKGKYDQDLYRRILRNPALIEAKRRQLELKKSLEESS